MSKNCHFLNQVNNLLKASGRSESQRVHSAMQLLDETGFKPNSVKRKIPFSKGGGVFCSLHQPPHPKPTSDGPVT